MTYSEFKNKMVAWWFGLADKTAKIAVAIVAVVAAVLALLGESWKHAEIGWAIAAAVLAVVLNVLPFGEYGSSSGRVGGGTKKEKWETGSGLDLLFL
ncbi:MAG TPA: hypothetical protein VNX28_02550 [Gemmataceae bacterium]|jgi:hypothetical protein|nr:hypothetical protein [Gemmataceae bacterium]